MNDGENGSAQRRDTGHDQRRALDPRPCGHDVPRGFRFEEQSHVSDSLQPFPWIFLETRLEQAAHSRGNARQVRSFLDDRRYRLCDVVALKGAPAREHLVKHDAECPDVGARVGGPSARLFGRHVGCSTKNHPDLSHRRRPDRGGHREFPLGNVIRP